MSDVTGDRVANPIWRFGEWLQAARDAGIGLPTAMTLATATPDGSPSARIVNLTAFDERGFVFFGHATSQKGQEIAANLRVALVFYWPGIERQIRVTGDITLLSDAEADGHFAPRPLEGKLTAWLPAQSSAITDYSELQRASEELLARFADGNVPRPDWWIGYRVVPATIEFWQGRADRLHERVRFQRSRDTWLVSLLAP